MMRFSTVYTLGRSIGTVMGASRSGLPLSRPPDSLCLLRLSALGDCVNVVPVIYTLQRHWPQTRLTWVIGKPESMLLGYLPGVEFIIYDKRASDRKRALRRQLSGRRFDVLLHMHPSLRANLPSRHIGADLRLGCDPSRARDGHRLFVDTLSRPPRGPHMVDGYFAFLETLGLTARELSWAIPIPDDARRDAEALLPPGPATLLINPSGRDQCRNWPAECYAAVADYAIKRYRLRVALIGGPGAAETALGEEIAARMRGPVTNLVGRTSLKTVLALMEYATVLLTPDSGPTHFANASRLPTISLHAVSPSARTGPYTSLQWAVDYHAEAARQFLGKSPEQMRWHTHIRRDGVTGLIPVAKVTETLDAILARSRG